MAHKGASGRRSVARVHTAARCRTDKVARAASKKPLHQGHVAGVLHLDGLCGMSVHVAWRHAPKGVVSVHMHPSVHGRLGQRGTTAARADTWLRRPHMNSRAWRGARNAALETRPPHAHTTRGAYIVPTRRTASGLSPPPSVPALPGSGMEPACGPHAQTCGATRASRPQWLDAI